MTKTLFLLIAMILSMPCLAFEIEGFKAGTSKATVIEIAKKNKLVTEAEENTLVAKSTPGDYLSFKFCEDRLVSVQQGYQANLRQVALFVS